ncbi:hypothetical protein ABQ179_016355 [Xanthomonas dyei]|uniref:hypothetical protein n=1 Tax=Xanthomonas dyei TaxID=743699 RepID=UPI0032E8EB5E
MKGAVPNVRKAKAIHEKKQAEHNATANKLKKCRATTREAYRARFLGGFFLEDADRLAPL